MSITRGKVASIACVTLLLALAIAMGFTRDLSGDFHWHVVVGRRVLEGSFGKIDTFSHTFAGQPVFVTSWLADALMALAFNLHGMTACFVLRAACTVLMFSMICREMVRLGLPAWAAVPPLILAMPWLLYRLVLRPEMFAFAAFAVLLHLCGEHQRAPKRWHLPAAIALIALWANLHGSVSIGLFALGLYCAEQVLRHWRERRRALMFMAVPALGFLAACLNPEGIRAPLAFRIVSPTWTQAVIEWGPLDWSEVPLSMRVLAFATAATTLVAIRRTSPWRLGLVLVLAWYASRYDRFATHAFLASMPLLAIDIVAIAKVAKHWRPAGAVRGVAAAIAMLVMAAGLWDLAFERRLSRQIGGDAGWYPEAACRFAHEARFEGKMLNSYDLGSYLMYCLPESPVYIDQRAWFVYPDAFLRKMLDGASTPEGLRQLADEAGVTWAFVGRDALGIQMSRDRASWRLVYFDDQAFIFVRAGASSPVPPFRFLGPLEAVELAHLEGDDLAVAREELALQESRCAGCTSTALVEAALSLAGHDADAPEAQRGLAFFEGRRAMDRSDFKTAARAYRSYLELGGHPVAGRLLVAEALARGGDRDAAARLLDEAAALPGGAGPAAQARGRFL